MSGTEAQRGQALRDCVVIEIGVHEAGQYCGKLLADFGARVVKLESLDGDRTRASAPFVHDVSGRRRSVPHEYLNAGKCSVAVDLDDAFLTELVRKLAGAHTLVLVAPEYAARIPKDLDVSVVVAGAYGASGRRALHPSTPFTRFHTGGSGYLLPVSRPTSAGTLGGECFAGAGIAVAALGALLMRRRNAAHCAGKQARIDHSQQAHAVNLEKMFVGRIAKERIELTRETHRYPFGGAVRCRDGHVSMLINERHQWRGFCETIGHPEWAEDKRFEGGAGRWNMQEQVRAALDAWCSTRSVEQVLEEMRLKAVPIGAIRSVQQVVASDELRSRGFLQDMETPYGAATMPGLPFGQHPLWKVEPGRVAPVLGEHTMPVLRELGYGDDEIAELETLRLIRCEHVYA